jgi:hypothetical protein
VLNRVKRVSAGLALIAVAATGTVAVTAGSASAAAQYTYVNDFVREFSPQTDPNSPVTPQGLCLEAKQTYNMSVYGNVNGGGDQYYYCATRSDGGENMWWRHRV